MPFFGISGQVLCKAPRTIRPEMQRKATPNSKRETRIGRKTKDATSSSRYRKIANRELKYCVFSLLLQTGREQTLFRDIFLKAFCFVLSLKIAKFFKSKDRAVRNAHACLYPPRQGESGYRRRGVDCLFRLRRLAMPQ